MSVDELFAAIEHGDQEVVEAILVGNPGIAAARNHKGTSAILWAGFLNQPGLAGLLAASRRSLDIHEAAALGRAENLAAMLDEDPKRVDLMSDDGLRPLHLAAMFGSEEA